MKKFESILLFITILSTGVLSQNVKEVVDADVNAGDTITWHSDTVYILTEKVFVESTAVLNIQAGTVIKGRELTGDNAVALIICRGAKIYATGSKFKPVIFTCESDDIGTLDPTIKSKWGGVVILGNAVTNEGEDEIEGIAPGDPRTLFGGADDNDNSGVIRYVSIRHSGATVAPDNELNGLSLGGVGAGTTLEYVEAYASSDDGFEWWGGNVNGRYLISAFCDDDAFDVDQGYRGTLQFLFAIQDSISTNNSSNWAGEWDGDDTKGAAPFGQWTIYNATFIGGGATGSTSNGGILLRANGAAKVYNSIFTTFYKDRGLVIEDLQDSSQDSRNRLEAGDIYFGNNIFWSCGAATQLSEIAKWTYKDTAGSSLYPAAAELTDSLTIWNNSYADPQIISVGWRDGILDPLLADESPALSGAATYPDSSFLESVTYRGAFGKDNWSAYWSGIWDEGILADVVTAKPQRPLRDADINAGETVTLSKDTVYILAEKVFVESTATLIIQPGTWIKGLEETGENATALVICRGGKIIADGTAEEPIVFTCESDDASTTADLNNLNKGKWGGLVILGNAITNEGEDEIEGILSGDPRSKFGGTDDADSSGILRYVSVRHAGASIAPDNELNGISLAAVGSKTILEYVEVFASSDDGFEWWGGAVNGKYLIAAFCDDDGFDIDQGFHGNLQFILSVQDSVGTGMSTNWAGEWDGDDTKGAEPFGLWSIANATMIGGGQTAASSNGGILIRANGAAKVYNSIICNFRTARGLVVEDLQDSSRDSRRRFDSLDIYFAGNIFYGIGGDTVLDSICRWTYKDENGSTVYPAAQELTDSLTIWNNVYANPLLTGIGYTESNGLIPQPAQGSPAYISAAILPVNGFFAQTGYKGAFGPTADGNWADGWSFLSEAGYMGAFGTVGIKKKMLAGNAGKTLLKINNSKGLVSFRLQLPEAKKIKLSLYNMSGRKIALLTSGLKDAGVTDITVDKILPTGLYICTLSSDDYAVSKRFSVLK